MSVHATARSGVPIADRPSLIDEILITHGPVELLSTFFLEAHQRALAAGVRLVRGTFEEMVAVNAANFDSWFELLPVFLPENGLVDDEMSECLFGLDETGNVVASHAVHIFDLGERTFAEEAESLRIFYRDPERMRLPAERCEVTSSLARHMRGRVAYSGSAWCRPDYRGRGISRIFPRVAKASAFTRWNPDHIVSFMVPSTYERGLHSRVGYTGADLAIELYNSFRGDFTFYFLTMGRDDLMRYVESFLGGSGEKVDARVFQRGAQ